MLITSKWAGNCRDCGTRFAEGTQVEWQRGQGASCCNLAPEDTQVEQPVIVDGAQRMEYRTGKAAQVAVDISGDSMVYEEKEYSGYNWMCLECRLVWDRKWQAVECAKRSHVTSFFVAYGGTVWDGRGFMPAGGLERGKYIPGTGATYTRTAVRREPSPDAPPGAPALAPSYNQVEEPEALHCELCGEPFQPLDDPRLNECSMCIDIRNIELDRVEEPAAQADPQDMTSEEMWDALTSPGTVTTTWN